MWQYVFLLLRRQPGKSVLASSGFLLAACALVLLSATTQTTVLQANQIISQNWRPSYDLVVLPPQAQIPTGKAVPADFLAGYHGGISIQQYEQIRQIAGVEVAAPVAYLGYVQIPSPEVAFSSTPLPGGYYQADWTLTEFNGKQTLTERHERFMYAVASSCTEDDSMRQELTSHPTLADALSKQDIQQANANCGFNGGGGPQTFFSLDTGPFLLTAIDPAAENQLVHLDQQITGGRMLTEQDTIQLNPNAAGSPVPFYQVPLLLQRQLPGQISLHVAFSRLTSQHIGLQQVLDRGGSTYLRHLPGQQTIFSHDAPTLQSTLPNVLRTGHIPAVYWDGHSWQPIYALSGDNDISFLYQPSGLTYQSARAPNGQSGPAYRLVPSSTQHPPGVSKSFPSFAPELAPPDQQGPEVAFRTLTPLHVAETNHVPYASAFYETQFIGQFNSTSISAQLSNPLNWLPETTYAAQPVQLRHDAQGRPVSPTNLLPTTNPAGFMLQPPLALTTLAAAQRIMGTNIISVIRVRVAGIQQANQASWNRVAQVAQEIRQRTGLQVLVTLGSSPQPTLVYVPGIKAGQDDSTQTIAPLGWIEERWIGLGVDIVYLHQLSATRLLLLGAVLLVCLGYLVVSLSSFVSSQRPAFAVLSALGWRPWQPTRLFLTQALLLALGGGIVGMGLALVIIALIGASPPWEIVLLTLPGVLFLALLSALYPLWQLWHIQPAEVLRAGSTISAGRTRRSRLGAGLPAVGAMALRNLLRSRGRALIAIVSLFLSAILLVVMVDGILAFRQSLQGTLLGDSVLLQTAVPLVAGGLFAVLLTFLSVADLLLLQVRERRHEIGVLRATGWRPAHVQRLFVQEGLFLALVGTIPGVLVALAVLAVQHATQRFAPLPLVALGTVLLLVLVTALASIPAVHASNRMQLADVLRAE